MFFTVYLAHPHKKYAKHLQLLTLLIGHHKNKTQKLYPILTKHLFLSINASSLFAIYCKQKLIMSKESTLSNSLIFC